MPAQRSCLRLVKGWAIWLRMEAYVVVRNMARCGILTSAHAYGAAADWSEYGLPDFILHQPGPARRIYFAGRRGGRVSVLYAGRGVRDYGICGCLGV